MDGGYAVGAARVRAAESVRLLTGLARDDAARVVADDHHGLPPHLMAPRGDLARLAEDVRAVVTDHLAVTTPATCDSVARLLAALGAPWDRTGGGTLVGLLGDGRRLVAVDDGWACLSLDDGQGQFWWTGLRPDCCDPLLVARTLQEISERARPAGGRRALSCAPLIPAPCRACGGAVVPWVFGYPTGSTLELARLGQVVVGGCVPPADGVWTAHACAACGARVDLG